MSPGHNELIKECMFEAHNKQSRVTKSSLRTQSQAPWRWVITATTRGQYPHKTSLKISCTFPARQKRKTKRQNKIFLVISLGIVIMMRSLALKQTDFRLTLRILLEVMRVVNLTVFDNTFSYDITPPTKKWKIKNLSGMIRVVSLTSPFH